MGRPNATEPAKCEQEQPIEDQRKEYAMKARELFALGVRVLGLVGLASVVHSVMSDMYHEYMLLEWPYYAVKFVYVLAGLYCVRGAPQLVAFAYPDEAKTPETKPPSS
jgi:hypothetical protein